MIANYYTIAAVCAGIRDSFTGSALGQPFTQSKHELVIPFSETPDDVTPALVVSCEPSRTFVAVRNDFKRARRNSTDIFAGYAGRTLRDAVMHPFDRQCALILDDGGIILIQLFGSSSNVYLFGPGRAIVDSFLFGTIADTSAPVFPFPASARNHADAVSAAIAARPDVAIESAVRSALPTLGPTLVRETLHRAHIDPGLEAKALDPAMTRSLTDSVDEIVSGLVDHPSPRLYYKEEAFVCLSLIRLYHLVDAREEPFESISGAIFRTLGERARQTTAGDWRHALRSLLRAELTRKRRTVENIRKDTAATEDPELHERRGKLLQAHMYLLTKGMETVEVKDFLADGEPTVVLSLDRNLSPAKNVERAFETARRMRRKREDHVRRVGALEESLKVISRALEEADMIVTPEEATTFAERYASLVPGLTSAVRSEAASDSQERFPFRRYVVDGGFEVWVGKNSLNNDLLSTRHTAKNDLWFHARGAGGSHVVIKVGTGRGSVSPRAITQAAAIAAHFSKMKKASHVAVSMCEGKFVRKPKGANPGTVTIEREDVLFVDPALPGGDGD